MKHFIILVFVDDCCLEIGQEYNCQVANYTMSEKKHPKHYRSLLEERISILNNFW